MKRGQMKPSKEDIKSIGESMTSYLCYCFYGSGLRGENNSGQHINPYDLILYVEYIRPKHKI